MVFYFHCSVKCRSFKRKWSYDEYNYVNDILNIDNTVKKPKFVKTYTNLSSLINKSVKQYVADVKNRKFPK